MPIDMPYHFSLSKIHFPQVFSVHKNGVLQTIDLENRTAKHKKLEEHQVKELHCLIAGTEHSWNILNDSRK